MCPYGLCAPKSSKVYSDSVRFASPGRSRRQPCQVRCITLNSSLGSVQTCSHIHVSSHRERENSTSDTSGVVTFAAIDAPLSRVVTIRRRLDPLLKQSFAYASMAFDRCTQGLQHCPWQWRTSCAEAPCVQRRAQDRRARSRVRRERCCLIAPSGSWASIV